MVSLKNMIYRTKLWIQQVNLMYCGKIKVDLLADEECFLRYIIETKDYLAELVIEPDGFHPHRYVQFIALDLNKKDTSSCAYCYYDNEDSSEEEIFKCLDEAISYIVN